MKGREWALVWLEIADPDTLQLVFLKEGMDFSQDDVASILVAISKRLSEKGVQIESEIDGVVSYHADSSRMTSGMLALIMIHQTITTPINKGEHCETLRDLVEKEPKEIRERVQLNLAVGKSVTNLVVQGHVEEKEDTEDEVEVPVEQAAGNRVRGGRGRSMDMARRGQ